MYTPEEEPKAFVIRIPWDSNTVRGFVCALLLILFFVIISPFITIKPAILRTRVDSTSIPIDIVRLHFGDGSGAGKSHGNLQKEGAAAKAQKSAERFADASAPKTATTKKVAASSNSTEFSTQLKLNTKDPNKNDNTANSKSNENTSTKKTTLPDNSSGVAKGDKNANDGTGRGIVGDGSGSGNGFNIEWGGGGGALVLNKRLPAAPKGLNNSTIVKLKFIVDKNGDVESVIPLTRGAPQAELAALKAMWLWKFKVKNEQRAEGVIKFTFDVN